MKLKQFISENREIIDRQIAAVLNYVPPTASCGCPKSGTSHMHDDEIPMNDRERRLWVMNHLPLYRLAQARGVEFE